MKKQWKKIKLEMHPTKDLKDRLIVWYPHKMKLDRLPLTQKAMLEAMFPFVDKKKGRNV